MNPVPENRPIVLITGAAGLIGERVRQHLGSEYQLLCFDVEVPEQTSPNEEWYKVDLTETASIQSALSEIRATCGPRIDSVLHLAAYYDFSGEPSPMYDKLTVNGTRDLLRALRQFDVGQFVFSSSLLVMQPSEDGSQISENSPVDPKWAYPQSKIEAEEIIRREADAVPTVILRIAGVYDEECHSLPLSQQVSRIYEKQLESYVYPGDSSHGQALVHLDDLAECFKRTIESRHDLISNEMFLIAEPDVMSYAELQDQLGELIHGREWATIRIPKMVAQAGAWVQEKMATSEEDKPFIKPWMVDLADDHYEPDITHARERLQWNPTHRLRDTLPQIIGYLKESPRRFYEENKLPIPDDWNEPGSGPPVTAAPDANTPTSSKASTPEQTHRAHAEPLGGAPQPPRGTKAP